MKVRYQGTSPVDIAGHFDVQPGAVVDVPTEQGNALLLAGTSIDAEGNTTPPVAPLWKLVIDVVLDGKAIEETVKLRKDKPEK